MRTGLYTGKTNEELVNLYKSGEAGAFEELMKNTEKLRFSLAQSYLNIPGSELEDLVSEGAIEMLTAIKNFDAEKYATTFSTFLYSAISRRYNTLFKKATSAKRTLTALGASGAVVSKHFDVIIGDDLVGFENARTEAQRKKLKEWFYSSLFPTLEPDGEIHILGTRYSPMDLYEDLIRSKNYKINIQQAITVKDNAEYSLWEAKFSLEKLRQIREESGLIIFNMQYQNNTELAKGKIFKYKYFKNFEEYEVDYDLSRVRVKVLDANNVPYWIPVRIYMGADLAISEDETSNNDYFVLTTIGVDKDKNVYVLDYLKERLTFNAQLNAILDYGNLIYPGQVLTIP